MTMLLRLARLLVAAGGPLLMAHAATAAGGDWSKDFTINGTADLRVEVDDGRVTLTGTDAKRIEVRVTAAGWKIGPDGVQVLDRQAGDRVEIDVRVPHSMGLFNMGNRSVRIEIRVPNGALANVHTHDGSITVEGLRGTLKLKTGDGRIEATRVDGTLDASSGDGSIRVRGRLDGLALRTADGSIEAELSAGSKMVSAWDVNTGDGHITLRLPKDFAADLDAHTGDGGVEVNFPITTSGTASGHDLRGKIGSGGPTLKIRSGDGAIRVVRD
jgi:hypothetical protein